ncbi:HAD-IC family P-type ATPase [soil metagenome]
MSSGLAVINATLGIIQEAIAKRRLDNIALLTRPIAKVMRDGSEEAVDPGQLVVGDLLVVAPGDQIMLDGQIVFGTMEVDESLITGEADAVHKSTGDDVLAGTFCVTGSARIEAQKVGSDTLAGSMTEGARAFTTSLTPLQRDVNLIVRGLLSIAVFLLVLTLISSLIWQIPFNETVIGAAVILGIVPSGLFLMITVTYSMGAVRLAQKQALVQQVNAVESLSNVDVFCADKTGTLTTNRLELATLHPIGIDEVELREKLAVYAASVSNGSKTVEAISTACPAERLELNGEVPFSSHRKWSAVSIRDGDHAGVLALGAPEMLGREISSMDSVKPPPEWYQNGLRVLLFAASSQPVELDGESEHPLPGELEPIGWVGLSDELRPNLAETLAAFRNANVRLKIISGDNPETVFSLARQAGFPEDARLVSGIELSEMSDGEFAQAAEEGDIFGRITPEQKERLVQAMRDHRHYVAMTGDGVNDVLSVKRANLGISMQSGSQATRALADIILLNDSFAAVPAAFAEGQRIRRGLQDILALFLVRVLTVSLLIVAVIFVGGGFPFSPATITLLTMLTVGFPTFALALFAHPGRVPVRIFKPLFRFVLPATGLLLVVSLAVYLGFYFLHDVDLDDLRAGSAAEAVRPQVSNALAHDALTYVLVLAGLFLVVFVAPPNQWWAVIEESEHDWRPTIVAAAMIPLYVAILAIPWTRGLFDIRLLPIRDYVLIAFAVIIWALALRYVWKYKVFERFLGLG